MEKLLGKDDIVAFLLYHAEKGLLSGKKIKAGKSQKARKRENYVL